MNRTEAIIREIDGCLSLEDTKRISKIIAISELGKKDEQQLYSRLSDRSFEIFIKMRDDGQFVVKKVPDDLLPDAGRVKEKKKVKRIKK